MTGLSSLFPKEEESDVLVGFYCLQLNFFQWDHSDNHDHHHDPTHAVAFPFEQFTGSSSIANLTKTEEAGDIDASANQVSGGGEESGDAIIKKKILSLPKRNGYDLVLPDRDSVLSRYKEKRKTRRYVLIGFSILKLIRGEFTLH